MSKRINFLDNFRSFLIFVVVLYHAGFVYISSLVNNWIVVDPIKNESIGLIGMYLDTFVMFGLFFISGYFIPQSVAKKTDGEFIRSKLKRILLPWVLAVFTLIPAYKIIFLYSRGMPREEWYSYFHFFMREGADLSLFSNDLSQHWLWFLPVLFLFQLLYWLLSKTGLFSTRISFRMGLLLTFVLSIAFSMLISFLELRGWTLTAILDFQRERILVYFMVFLLGALAHKHQLFSAEKRNIPQLVWVSIAMSLAITVYTIVALNLFFNIIDPGREFYFVSPVVDRMGYYAAQYLTTFCFLYVIADSFQFTFNKSGKLAAELNQNSYNVYIIHMVVLGLVALPMIGLGWPVMVKYLVLALVTYLICNLLVSLYYKLLRLIS
jgi:hypothetical protein